MAGAETPLGAIAYFDGNTMAAAAISSGVIFDCI